MCIYLLLTLSTQLTLIYLFKMQAPLDPTFLIKLLITVFLLAIFMCLFIYLTRYEYPIFILSFCVEKLKQEPNLFYFIHSRYLVKRWILNLTKLHNIYLHARVDSFGIRNVLKP